MKRKRQESQSLSQLPQLLTFLTKNTNASSSLLPTITIAIQRLLQTRGTLIELLTCNDALYSVAYLSNSSLSALFSSLYQSEICQDSFGGQDAIRCGSGSFGPSSSTVRSGVKQTFGVKQNAHSILRFTERVLMIRFHVLQQLKDDSCTCIIDAWRNFKCDTSIGDNEEVADYGSGKNWIPCMIFMMAYSALYDRLRSGVFSAENQTKDTAVQKVGNDPIISTALRLMLLSKQLAIWFDSTSDGSENSLKSFQGHLAKVDSLVGSIGEARSEANDNDGENPISQTSQSIDFDLLWEEVQADNSLSDDEEHVDAQPKGSQEGLPPVLSALSKDDANDEPSPTDGETNVLSAQTCTMKAYEKAALDLRPTLLQMSDNAASNDIESMTNQIASILQDGGAQDGAEGITKAAAVLKYGSPTKEDEEVCSFSDSLISSLSKACIAEEMSAARVASFLQSFVLPSIYALQDAKSRPASRQLVTTLTTLARDRPTDCINSLLVPTMMGNSSTSINEMERVNTGPSKAQCELIGRIVKSTATFQPDDLSKLVSELVPTQWTELSVAVLTTCIQKKPTLSEPTITALADKFSKCSNEQDLAKGTKFSSFFHAFVTKYGPQIQSHDCTDGLLEAAENLKTFLGKSITTSLKKLQKK